MAKEANKSIEYSSAERKMQEVVCTNKYAIRR
jgi:hypothetical protein